jgi:glycosyltransferase involved in cell wall biosynthesis
MTRRKSPTELSVVMPVYNALPHLDPAIRSILDQGFADFEFVIFDDGSTDGSTDRLRDWARRDSRIRLIESEANLGPARSSDRVAREAKGAFIARMDADDISYPDRLAEQLELLRSDESVGLVASLSDLIDSRGRRIRSAEPWRLLRKSAKVPFVHGSIMFRRSIFEQAAGYRQDCDYWEDQDLVVRMAAISKVLVIPRALCAVRIWTTSTRTGSDQEGVETAFDSAYRSVRAGKDRNPGGKIDPRAFVALGSVTLWAGGRPRLFRRLLGSGDLSVDFRTISALIWTGWASVSPGSLRSALRLLLAARNARARRLLSGSPVTWSPTSNGASGRPAG